MRAVNNLNDIFDLNGVLLRVEGHGSAVLLLLVHSLGLDMNQLTMHVEDLEVLLLQAHDDGNSLSTVRWESKCKNHKF